MFFFEDSGAGEVSLISLDADVGVVRCESLRTKIANTRQFTKNNVARMAVTRDKRFLAPRAENMPPPDEAEMPAPASSPFCKRIMPIMANVTMR